MKTQTMNDDIDMVVCCEVMDNQFIKD